MSAGILDRYHSRLPAVEPAFWSSMAEGGTPLLPSRSVGPALGLRQLYFKCEHLNPSGSYKDRFIALEVSLQRQAGARLLLGTSSGNTGASLAACAARYGMPCHLFVCERTPSGKLVQMRAHGAHVHRVRGFCVSAAVTDGIMQRLAGLAEGLGARPVISAFCYAPEGMQGVQTISYEISEVMEPSHVFAPGGGCGLLLAVARGFTRTSAAPKVHIVQPRLNDTVVTQLRSGAEVARAVDTTTSISGLAVPQVLDGTEALQAARASGGSGFLIDDEDALRWQQTLLQTEGVWVEPAGAVALAGLEKAVLEGAVKPDEPVVCLLTGHGFKDVASVVNSEEDRMIEPEEMEGIVKG